MLCFMERVTHFTSAFTLFACSGHQTFDDGSDALGGRKPTRHATDAEEGLAADAALAPDASPSDAGADESEPAADATDAASARDRADAGQFVPVGQLPQNTSPTHEETEPPPVEPTCYGEGANEDPSFASTELECNQTYCREQTGDPVVLPWSIDAAPPCRTALGNACGTQLDEGNFTYRVEDGPFSLEFSFDPRLGQDGFTDEAFTARFVSLTMLGMRGGQTQPPAAANSEVPDFRWVRYDVRWEAQELYDAGYSFSNGRFAGGAITGTVTQVYYDLAEQFPEQCAIDAAAIDCKCLIDGVDFDYQLRLEAQLAP